jgi:hypothetical protein
MTKKIAAGDTDWCLEKVKVKGAGGASRRRKGNHEKCCAE